jgi:hypothetical protein
MAGPIFFDNEPKDGAPLSLRGVFRGLRRIQESLRFLSVSGGRVVWQGYRPKIIIDNVSATGTGDGLPAVTAADKNKVIIVSAAGEWEVDYPRFHS